MWTFNSLDYLLFMDPNMDSNNKILLFWIFIGDKILVPSVNDCIQIPGPNLTEQYKFQLTFWLFDTKFCWRKFLKCSFSWTLIQIQPDSGNWGWVNLFSLKNLVQNLADFWSEFLAWISSGISQIPELWKEYS